ncbi:hypothetical protein KSP35_06075 [Aquihabitans sp. G128]|uniref:hypothetical protein n=1 Tax=Aquihabitans sp. G128 TaxID=2849779 RepID=UPI001C213953|nr:hypothetical protein [Aquihabitans sp. G128]QXC62368.1 hypothetical protein KSP35_06075 [Aquihabitans sp. G128]
MRLEGLGTFAVPLDALGAYRLAVGPRTLPTGAIPSPVLDALPLILEQDFLRTTHDGRRSLVVDDLGCIRLAGTDG